MENREKIFEQVKTMISIDNYFRDEENNKKSINKKVYKAAATIALIFISTTGIVFAGNIVEFIENIFGINSSNGVDIAINNGYIANYDLGHIETEDIEISLVNLLIDDYNFGLNFDINFKNNYNLDEVKNIIFEDMIVTDEDEEIVFNTHINKYEKKEMTDMTYKGGYSFLSNKVDERNIRVSLIANGNEKTFPKSKHLTVYFTKIRILKGVIGDSEDEIYQGNWKFEINVPEEFYSRQSIIYKAIECNDSNININSIVGILSNTTFKLYIPEIITDKINYNLFREYNNKSIKNKMALRDEYIETTEKKKFDISQTNDGEAGYGVPKGESKIVKYHQTFNLTRYDATEKIRIHLFTNKEDEIIIEMRQSK